MHGVCWSSVGVNKVLRIIPTEQTLILGGIFALIFKKNGGIDTPGHVRSERNKVERLQQPKVYVATVTARGGQGGHMPPDASRLGRRQAPPTEKTIFFGGGA